MELRGAERTGKEWTGAVFKGATMIEKYYYSKNHDITDEQAQIFGDELDRIREKYGRLFIPQVVAEARYEKSTIHDFFEWDNEIAGERFRIDQARILQRSIYVDIVTSDDERIPTRAFVDVGVAKDQEQFPGFHEFTSIDIALKDKEKMEMIIGRAFSELKKWATTYRRYLKIDKDFGEQFKLIFDDIEALEEATV